LQTFRCVGTFERQAREAGYRSIAGVDEAGRGSLFGPVFAAAVVLRPDRPVRGLRDSKVVPAVQRAGLADVIKKRALAWAVAAADVFEIDRMNIYQASRLAMRRAVEQLNPPADYLLVDAVSIDVPISQRSIVHGDARCQCIAAASILAKTHRDACLDKWDAVFPEYGLRANKGYFTPDHKKALERYGPTNLHRYTYDPVRLNSRVDLHPGAEQRSLFESLAAAAGGA
jgi:ribonuclease HII